MDRVPDANSPVLRPRSDGVAQHERQELDPDHLWTIGLAVLIAVGLTILTIVTFIYLPRYDLPGEPYIDNADFRDGFAGWDIGGIVTLDEVEVGLARLQSNNPDDEVFLRRRIDVPPGQTSLLLSADVATNQVRRGEEPWQSARIYLVQLADDGTRLWDRPHLLVELVGTAPRHHVEEIFEIPASVDRVLLGIELPFATGQFEIADLRLALLDELPVFRLATSLLVAAWCILAVWTGRNVLSAIPAAKLRTLVLLALGLTAAAMVVPADARRHVIDSLATGFGLTAVDPDTLGHAAIFLILALLVRCGRPRDPLILHLSCWFLVGAATEVLQLLTGHGQAPLVSEWIGDAVGAALGLLLAEIGLRLERLLAPRRRPRPDPAAWPDPD